MRPPTDCIRRAARLARKLRMDAAVGRPPQADAEFYRTPSKVLDETAAGPEMASAHD